jgi:hypothetical protein
LEARFASSRYTSYRAYEFNFTGSPTETLSVATFTYGISLEIVTTLWYVSWNGVTEVASWNFYSAHNMSDEFCFVGNISKIGFETMFMSSGHAPWTIAETISKDGRSLGQSLARKTDLRLQLNSPPTQGSINGADAVIPPDGHIRKLETPDDDHGRASSVGNSAAGQSPISIGRKTGGLVFMSWLIFMGLVAKFFRRGRR